MMGVSALEAFDCRARLKKKAPGPPLSSRSLLTLGLHAQEVWGLGSSAHTPRYEAPLPHVHD